MWNLEPFNIYILYVSNNKVIFSMWNLKPFCIYTLCSQEKNYGFSMWDKKNFSLNKLGVIIFGSVRLLLKTNNQTEFKKKPKPNRNRFKPIQTDRFRFNSVF
jgi:hypothetical protein